jgi:urease accessory protein
MIRERTDRSAGAPAAPPDAYLELPYGLRARSRLRATLVGGEEVGIILARGQVLRDGDRLRADDGRVIAVRAAAECVSTVHAAAPGALLRAAYHLGNRHVALQITPDWLRYLHDHVLDDMVRGLGLRVTVEQAPFEPEPGAYGSHGTGAHGGHGHGGHAHRHDHPHDHGGAAPGGHDHDHEHAASGTDADPSG